MDNTQKFISDIQRIKKHARADNGGNYDSKAACSNIISLFERNNRSFSGLPHSLGEYWEHTYVDAAEDRQNAPDDNAIDKIGAMQAFLSGEEGLDALSQDDWKEIGRLVNFEAEDLPIEDLSRMMSVIVEKGALN